MANLALIYDTETTGLPLHGAAQSLLTLARNLRLTLAHNGEWDDGCFYYHRTAAPELGVLDQHAEAAIAQAELPATED